MKQNLPVRLSLIGLTVALLLSCFVGCTQSEDPDVADTTVAENPSNADTQTPDDNTGTPEENTSAPQEDATTSGEEADTEAESGQQGSAEFPTAGKEMADIVAEINSRKVEDFVETTEKSEFIKIIVQGYGEIVVRLRPDIASANAGGIQWLLGYNYYRGLTIHRVLKDSFIQGGCPNGDGSGGSGISLRGEFADNGVANPLLHVRGVVSAHREEDDFNSASSQFLILTKDCPQFDGNRTAFGYVVAGMEVVDAISGAQVQDNGKGEVSSPVERIVMEKIVFVKLK